MKNCNIKYKRLSEEDFYKIEKEIKESKFVILCTEHLMWLYGESAYLLIGLAKLINELGGSVK